MIGSVDINTAARLHFGLICGPPDSVWHYGGIGLMVNEPGWHLRVSRASGPIDQLRASPVAQDRLRDLLGRFRAAYALPPVRIETVQETGFHTGLGSGTQLTLAAATACLLLTGQPRPRSVAKLAEQLGRRRRSAIGTFGFDHGGLIVDRGRCAGLQQPAIEKFNFPEDWRMVVVTPVDTIGLSGASEEQFFGERRYLDADTVGQLGAIVEQQLCPAVESRDFASFREALQQYGDLVGEYYAARQGGIFSHPLIRTLVPRLSAADIAGAVQSSWGPSIAIPASSPDCADEIVRTIRKSGTDALQTTITTGVNHGATVRTPAPDSQRSFG